MRRVLQFLSWQSGWWEERVGSRGLEEGPQAEGEDAYALQQAWLQRERRSFFVKKWEKAGLTALIQKGRAGDAGDAAATEATRKGRGMGEAEEGQGEAEETSSEEEDDPVPETRGRGVVVSYNDLD